MSSHREGSRGSSIAVLALTVAAVICAPTAAGQWVQFANETATRNTIEDARFETDPEEKDYAWGDVDNDGDVDLVVVRKQPFTTAGKRPNYLFINEDGVFTDRTDDFATASDVPGDQGFDTPTNDRDVVLSDLDLDGWLDVVTAPTISDGDPKHIGHPRIYVNRKCTGACAGTADWRGFRFENDRIPTMVSYTGQSGFNPRFCSVDAGDVTGDDYPELWFGDYDSSGAGGLAEPAGGDFNDRLLINRGDSAGPAQRGHFDDGSTSRFSGAISVPGTGPAPFVVSAFVAAAELADVNGDGYNDIVKQTALNAPTYVGFAYNNLGAGAAVGQFQSYETVYLQSPYFVSTGDLNNDDKLDIVITDDGADRYLLNQGNGADGMANFQSSVFSFQHVGGGSPNSWDDGFGSQSLVVDLDNDGWQDVLISDVNVDISGCSRRAHIYRNLGGAPGGAVTLQEQTTGTSCAYYHDNPASCLVASIPADMLTGTYHVAAFDIDGDGWRDLVLGRCTGTQVWINQPPPEPVGMIVDEDGTAGQALLLDKQGLRVHLNWGGACSLADTDYAVYKGTFDPANPSSNTFTNHGYQVCSTAHLNTYSYVEDSGSYYYLVVPHDGAWEGSYGEDSYGAQRQQGSGGSCHAQNVGSCE
jgi:hypothetical protein